MNKQEFEIAAKKIEKELDAIYDRIRAKKSITDRQRKMAEIGFAYGFHTGSKEIVKRGI